MKRSVLCLALLLFSAAPAFAEASFQVAFAGARAPDDPNVNGFRLSLFYAKAQKMHGFDLGLISLNESTNQSGVAINFGLTRVKGKSSGFASSLVNVQNGSSSGFNAAFINLVETLTNGVNAGFVNITDGYSEVDLSGLGVSKRSNVQIGFVNVTEKIEGVQIGILNIAQNGFFPVFPLFNFPKK